MENISAIDTLSGNILSVSHKVSNVMFSRLCLLILKDVAEDGSKAASKKLNNICLQYLDNKISIEVLIERIDTIYSSLFDNEEYKNTLTCLRRNLNMLEVRNSETTDKFVRRLMRVALKGFTREVEKLSLTEVDKAYVEFIENVIHDLDVEDSQNRPNAVSAYGAYTGFAGILGYFEDELKITDNVTNTLRNCCISMVVGCVTSGMCLWYVDRYNSLPDIEFEFDKEDDLKEVCSYMDTYSVINYTTHNDPVRYIGFSVAHRNIMLKEMI